VNTTVAVALDGTTDSANDFRLGAGASAGAFNQSSAIGSYSGLRPSGGNPGLLTYTSGLSFTVNPFMARIQGTDVSTQGPYECALSAQSTLTTVAADTSNPRWDLVGVKITDLGNSGSTSQVTIVTGAPAGSPADPATGTNFLKLGRLVVPANATNLGGTGGQGSIQDLRTWAVSAGGITPVANSAAYPTTGAAGGYYHDLSTGALGYWNGSANKVLRPTVLEGTRSDGNTLATSAGHTPSQITWATSPNLNQDFGIYPSGAPTNFTLPSDGFWLGGLHVTYDSNSTGERRIHLKQNSLFFSDNRLAVGASNADPTHCTAVWGFSGHAGDTIGFYTDHDSGSTRTLSNQSFFLARIW
jgi:hypothetical protein